MIPKIIKFLIMGVNLFILYGEILFFSVFDIIKDVNVIRI